jgi:hypothetical protein
MEVSGQIESLAAVCCSYTRLPSTYGFGWLPEQVSTFWRQENLSSVLSVVLITHPHLEPRFASGTTMPVWHIVIGTLNFTNNSTE